MIVALAAWLYIIQALLGLASLFSGPFGLGGGSGTFASLLMSAIFGAIGYGLLKREAWGRWLALGVSLLAWVFGSLMLVCLIGALALSGKTGAFIGMMFSGAFAVFAVMLVIGLVIMIVSLVINFKLFFYLCSEDGCEEFGVPYGSTRTVLASAGAWLALMFGQVFMTTGSGGFAALLARQAMARDHRDDRDQESARMRLEAEREYRRQEEERRRHAEQEARLRAIRDAENPPPPESAAVTPEPVMVDSGYSTVAAETPAPASSEPSGEEKTSGNTILKCRDASGAVMFTQGYCPPGTQRVEMPRNE